MSATKVYDIPVINNAPFERYVIIAAPAANSNRTNPNEIFAVETSSPSFRI